MEDKVLETVVEGIKYNFLKDVLVKPLEKTKVQKEFTEQIPTGETDEDGYNKYETKTEVREVESDWSTGVVIALPAEVELSFKLGDTVVYNSKFAKDFDLFKNSQLVKPYDVIAIMK